MLLGHSMTLALTPPSRVQEPRRTAASTPKNYSGLGNARATPRVVDALVALLTSGSEQYDATRTLGQLGDRRAVEPLLTAFLDMNSGGKGECGRSAGSRRMPMHGCSMPSPSVSTKPPRRWEHGSKEGAKEAHEQNVEESVA